MKRIILIACAAILTMVCHAQSEEESNLLFLYENMSLPDRIDYDSAYYRQQVRLALQARREMPWGTSVPEREFRHFVLPPRVSNEDLDTARAVFFRELKPRLQGLTMSEAVLEVNHWCHEHVTYRPTDARTLSPLATYRTAYGRCGEESVFTVAALRAVGIPARQVYTPRWAHTDDNHAWVEAWADGRWWFLGACEPEPILNMGWFNESASRGMLMHTKVFGNYDGPEEVVNRQYALTEINVIGNYAPARRLTVTVLDSLDRPVPGVAVGFKVYNYAEFFTVAAKLTDAAGQASLTAGHGDMLVWASTPTAYAFAKASFATDSTLTLKLTNLLPTVHSPLSIFHYPLSTDLNITPPPISATLPTVSPAQRAANDRRLAVEDSIRHAYELTMPDPRSRGNHAVIAAFRDSAAARSLTSLSNIPLRALADTLLSILPDKDLQDITLEVLLDNLPPEPAIAGLAPESAIVGLPGDVTLPYLLSPRIDRERLTAYKAPLRAAFKDSSIQQLIAWTRDSITLVTNQNPQHLRIQPLGVYRSRTADAAGRNIFFVAAARAIGIPARINEINGKVQYYDRDWIDVAFDTPVASSPNREVGRALFTYTPVPYTPDPKYYTHFTLSKLTPRNTLQLLTYPWGSTFESTFRNGVTLDAGTYFLTTGIRMADGSVRAHLSSFTIAAGDTTTVPLHLRTATDAVTVIGSLNAEDLYHPLSVNSGHLNSSPDGEAGRGLSLLATCGRGYYAIGLIAPNHEPTNHVLRDIALVREDFERWGRKLVLLFEDQESASRFNFSEIQGLPSTTVWGTDIDGHIRAEILGQMNLPTASLPIFLICDSFNRVVFVQQGYTIGLGEQMQKVIQQLK